MNPTKNPGPLGEKRSTKFRGCLSCVVNVDSPCLSPGSFLLMALATRLHLHLSKRLRGAFPSDCGLRRMCLGNRLPLLRQHTLVQLQGASVRVGYPLNFSFIKNYLKYAFEGGVPLQGNAKKSTFQRPPVFREAKRNHEAVSGGSRSHTQGLSGRGSLLAQLFPNPLLLPE